MCFVLIPLIVGSIDIGRVLFSYGLLAHAANEGARWASFDNDKANIQGAAKDASGLLALQASDITVICYSGVTTTTKECALVLPFDVISVEASSVFLPITPKASEFMPNGQLTLRAVAKRTFQ